MGNAFHNPAIPCQFWGMTIRQASDACKGEKISIISQGSPRG